MRPQAKVFLAECLRRLHLLTFGDRLKLLAMIVANSGKNRRFRKANPGYAVPPYLLAYDAFGHVDWPLYRASGRQQAEFFSRLITEFCSPRPDLQVLEWGCGPGRVIRHINNFLSPSAQLTGTDVNAASIAWCRRHLPEIAFAANRPEPPLPLPAATFDIVLCRSVFTHLSESMHRAWIAELRRVLKPGGLIMLTSHGDHFRQLCLSAEEQRRYDEGQLVIHGSVNEGAKWFAAFHSPLFVRRNLLAGMEILRHLPGPNAEWFPQDVWIARRPG